MIILPKLDALRQFFGTEQHPVTTAELTQFKKQDPEGFEEVAKAAAEALAKAA